MNTMYTSIVGCLLSDVVGESYSETECRRDIAEMRKRVKAQGISFLTKDLPRFGKAIDLALAKQIPLRVTGFKKKHGTELPQFLWELTSKVFDLNGCELPLGNAQALRSLRQIAYSFYKLELPYSESDKQRVIESFVQVDADLKFDLKSLTDEHKVMFEYARGLIHRVLSTCDPRLIKPRHGPGVVSTGEKPWDKPYFEVYNTKIAEYYNYEDYFFYNYSHLADDLRRFLSLPEVADRPAKVVLVPKDSRGPRLISCEPVENQWIQQGQMRLLIKHLEQHELTKGHLNFTDQTYNRWYAWLGSQDGELVTLDMKEASDRVSLALVEELFPQEWVKALKASRSACTELPDGDIVYLNKFAPMGSAVCFPVEALIFYAIGVAAISCTRGIPLSQARKFYYVYGDDLVCSHGDHVAVSQLLSAVGLLLNEDKCCTRGLFRESCGLDAYRGTDVTPLKLRSVWVMKSSRLSPESYLSYVAYSNEAYRRGYYNTAQYIEDKVRESYPRTPTFNREGGCIAFVRSDKCIRARKDPNDKVGYRINPRTHVFEVKGLYARALVKRVRKTGWEELLRCESQKPVERSNLEGLARFPASAVNPPGLENDDVPADDVNMPQLSEHERLAEYLATGVGNPPCHSVLTEPGLYTVPHRYRLQSRWTAVP